VKRNSSGNRAIDLEFMHQERRICLLFATGSLNRVTINFESVGYVTQWEYPSADTCDRTFLHTVIATDIQSVNL